MPAGASSRPGSDEVPDASFGLGTASEIDAIGPGTVVLVVGPSGVGKDSILRHARDGLAGDDRYFFPRRTVTRTADGSEDHDTLSVSAFDALAARGGFALNWHAHGHRYGIPVTADAAARAGRTVVFNASRLIVPAARQRYAATAVVLIDAPLNIRAARLAARDRESAEEVLARMGRVVTGFTADDADLVIDNGGPLAESVLRLVGWLRGFAGPMQVVAPR